ncbi:uncharacterized protein LOC128883336 [Hylaeus volcanicus]|uniref:uncharacterized protein LOC128883336 n=1 Tax=Hylaeus volcanicus TaxID=313075 RepID=UPI0023B8425F|nr:uncharacterized protein LOC128883336 [Hylaeus volcanicus]
MLCDTFFHLIPQAFQMASHNFTNSLSVWECFTLGFSALIGMIFVVIVHTVLSFVNFYYQFQNPPLSCASQDKSLTKNGSFFSIKNSSPSQKNKKQNRSNFACYDSSTVHEKHACHVPLKLLLENTENVSNNTNLQHIPHFHKIKQDRELTLAHTTLLSSALHNIVDGIFVGIAHKTAYQHQCITTGMTLFFHEVPSQITNVILLKRAGYADFDACLLNLLATGSFYAGIIMIFSGFSGENHFGLHIATASNFLIQSLTMLLPELLSLFSFCSLIQVIIYKKITHIQEILTCMSAIILGFLCTIGLLFYEHN